MRVNGRRRIVQTPMFEAASKARRKYIQLIIFLSTNWWESFEWRIFMSVLDTYPADSTDSTFVDLCKAFLIPLGAPFRIRRVPRMTKGPVAVYYPLEVIRMGTCPLPR